MPALCSHHPLILCVHTFEDACKSPSNSEQMKITICYRQISVSHHSELTTMGCLSQYCTSAIPCHTPSLAVPLVLPGASSSSSLIPVLCGSRSSTVWEHTGAAYNRLPVVAKRLVNSSVWSPTELRYMSRKTRVRAGDFSRLFTNCSLPTSVRPWKSLWG